MFLLLVLLILHAWLPSGTASTGKYSSPVSAMGCWQWCSCRRHASVRLSGWEEVGIQVSHLSVALTTSVIDTDNVSSARWCCRELLLSKNRSRHLFSWWDSGLWMETTTWCLVLWNFGKWVRLWIYSVVSFPPWLHGHVLNESEVSHPPSHSWSFCTPLGPLYLPLHFRFPFGTKFLKKYALKCLTWRCPSPLWDPTFSLNLLS